MAETETEISADFVAALLRDQHPDLAGLPLAFGARGWDNQLWRLGDDLAVRLPWATTDADELLRKEHALLPALAPRLPLPIPTPLRLGEPSDRFPHPWLITTWVPGTPADRDPVTRLEAASTLSAFLSTLHGTAADGVPAGRHKRGGDLADTSEGFDFFFEDAVKRGLLPNPGAVRAVWDEAVTAPKWTGPPVWLHGDLHPANLLTRDGDLCGVIDFGDTCAGDPACDLAAAWHVLPDGGLDLFHRGYTPGADAASLLRARGWAVTKALACLIIGDNGVHGRPGGKPSWGPPASAALRRLTS
ncbi:aminoglycoside phosphotransferase family protein [Actinokineospora spheciospongiae]|uniref:aminoglycoside phosphotransferase family protein n=1 Tax=Actinokineospora spheciospongiae TaxID=909613 RepID=UPI000555F597|nr:aminoglycoside phosphotransferase family protein [Actinokineospora spheciospongiae]